MKKLIYLFVIVFTTSVVVVSCTEETVTPSTLIDPATGGKTHNPPKL